MTIYPYCLSPSHQVSYFLEVSYVFVWQVDFSYAKCMRNQLAKHILKRSLSKHTSIERAVKKDDVTF